MLKRTFLLRLDGAVIGAALTLHSIVAAATAAPFGLGALEPSTLFIQAGAGDQTTQAYMGGATWHVPWRKQYSLFVVSGYFEAAIGRWTTRDSSAWATQLGLTPVIRLRPSGHARDWFAELGVGANYIVPLYKTDHKRFSTEFNFGDHIAIGRQFGGRRQHEVAVRVEHFSNAGIAHPNPGENFVGIAKQQPGRVTSNPEGHIFRWQP
jgi:lipid A 3-O-deacylase